MDAFIFLIGFLIGCIFTVCLAILCFHLMKEFAIDKKKDDDEKDFIGRKK